MKINLKNLSNLFASAALALMVTILVTPKSAHAKNLDYLDFEGSYKLVRSQVGQCEPILAVYRQNDDENEKNMIVGQFLMRNIDGGQTVYEDLFARRVFTTTIRGNVLESKQKIWDKSYKRTELRRYGIRKTGKKLSLWSYNNQTRVLPIKCTYRLDSVEPVQLPWDPGLSTAQ